MWNLVIIGIKAGTCDVHRIRVRTLHIYFIKNEENRYIGLVLDMSRGFTLVCLPAFVSPVYRAVIKKMNSPNEANIKPP